MSLNDRVRQPHSRSALIGVRETIIINYAAARIRRLREEVKYLPATFVLVWRAASRWTSLWLLLLIVQGILPLATVYLTRSLVNHLVGAIRAGGEWTLVQPALISASLLLVVMLASEALRALSNWVRTAQSDLVQDYITALVHERSATVDLAFYDSPEFYDHLHRARSEASYRPAMLIETLGSILQNGITLLAMGAVLIPFGPLLPLALIVSTLPAFTVVLRSAQKRHEFLRSATALERQSWYYDSLLTTVQSAAEIRLFGLGSHFRAAYESIRRDLRRDRLTMVRAQGIGELFAALSAMAVTGTAMLWMVWRAMRGMISLGDLAMFYQAFNQGLGLARSLLENIGRMYENSLFLGNLFEFLAINPSINDPKNPRSVPPKLREGICFENVTFRYPGTDRVALRNFNLAIAPGQFVAIVGPNGAGKSTLAKLLCRFYDPDQGTVSLDGVPLHEMRVHEIRRQISALFQEPVRYEASAAENITYSDMTASRDATLKSATHESGAEQVIARLPHGLETHLGKSFAEGVQLSVGEWQRLALARAFFRSAPIVILDEPTSAMDPWAEIEWTRNLRRFVSGRIIIMITHRFTAAMFADVIYVVSAGEIVESGSHDELMRKSGLYAQAWAAQSESSVASKSEDVETLKS